MRRKGSVGVLLCVMVGTCWTSLAQVNLDGKQFSGLLTSQKDRTTNTESIIFTNGLVRSTACEAKGFKAGAYTIIETNGQTIIKGSVANENGDVNELEATVKGDTLTGTLTARLADGTTGGTLILTARLARKVRPPMNLRLAPSGS